MGSRDVFVGLTPALHRLYLQIEWVSPDAGSDQLG